ncbi:MAG: nucleotidyltransferase domain-containing protein [Hyphomonadaceae bacterium]|nr:nucleotidyltransferase domain-containing protein [Hyphomonadaceae bacterium]
MDRTTALRILRELQSSLHARGVEHAALFGSVARGQNRPLSDIDVLITPKPGRKLDLFDLGAIQSILESGFEGRRVDVLVEPIRQTEIREAAREDRVHAF